MEMVLASIRKGWVMLTVTTAASDALESIVSARELPASGGVRLAYRPGSDGQPGLSLTIVAQPDPQDDVFDASAVALFLQPQAAALVDDKVLDVQVDGAGDPGFVLTEQ
jgi:Fe-S cluster assembly iron-binding protein IscA